MLNIKRMYRAGSALLYYTYPSKQMNSQRSLSLPTLIFLYDGRGEILNILT